MSHSFERERTCAACGDLDGCHLWQINGVPVAWDADGFARIGKRMTLRLYPDNTWVVYVDNISRAKGWTETQEGARALVITAAKLVWRIVEIEDRTGAEILR